MCGSDAENNVRVQYVSDGRTYNGSGAVTGTMGFKIQYKFLQCSTVIETTTEYDQQASTNPDNNHSVSTSNVAPHSTVATISATEITQTDTTTKSAITDTENDDAASKETDGNSDGISDTAKLFLVSIPGFIGIIILVVTAIVFCRKRGDKSQKYKNFEKDNVGENKMGNAESPIQEPDHDTATAENNEPTTSTVQDEETPYAIMYSALARKDKEGDANELLWDEKKTSAIEEDEHKYDMYSAVVRKTEGGDKETIHV
ncbi:uncharacterized protein LOC144424570 isoform X2 [Styela clava]